MFNNKKSYSELALTRAINAVRVIDENIISDFNNYGPKEIPNHDDFQIKSFSSVFNLSRKKKAAQRVAFNIGLISGVVNNFFDGESKDFDIFLKNAVISGAHMGETVIKDLGKVEKKNSKEFEIGFQYAKGFIERNLKLD